MTVAMERAAEERKAAAVARTAGAAKVHYYRSRPPQGVEWSAPAGVARSLPFAAQMRAKLEERDGQELYHLNGIASVTDTPYDMYDDFGPYEEIVTASAFSDTLSADPDVAFLVNHRGVTMARTTNNTLKLALTGEGLQSDAWLNPKRQDVKDLVIAIEDRNIDQMSFAFMLEEGWWNDDFSQFKITKLDIHRGDVSAVNYGANPYTSIAARSMEILDDLEHLPAGAKRAALARLGTQDSAPVTAPPAQPDPAGMDVSAVNAWLLQHS
jgi:hypothetical protein